jgi:mRNA-degrading endonuclease YafQ of YafQ-DinJ toxin-antitoxin module
MRRNLLQSPGFVRAARRLVKKHPEIAPILRAAFVSLAEDAFQPAMKTHKLKGELAGLWACSIGYDLRIVTPLWHGLPTVPLDPTEGLRFSPRRLSFH